MKDPEEPTVGYRFDTSFYNDGDDPEVDDIERLAESMARSSLEAERSSGPSGYGLDGNGGKTSDSKGLDEDYWRQ